MGYNLFPARSKSIPLSAADISWHLRPQGRASCNLEVEHFKGFSETRAWLVEYKVSHIVLSELAIQF